MISSLTEFKTTALLVCSHERFGVKKCNVPQQHMRWTFLADNYEKMSSHNMSLISCLQQSALV